MNHIEFMRLAEAVAKQSVCKRAQVGAVVANSLGRMTGFNHRPNGGSCECEEGKTLTDVVHAEAHVLKVASWRMGCHEQGGTLYVTRQPCIDCAGLIVSAGIEQVFYRDADDKTDGLELLAAHGVKVDSGWIAGQREPLIETTLMQKIQASWSI